MSEQAGYWLGRIKWEAENDPPSPPPAWMTNPPAPEASAGVGEGISHD